MRNNGKLMRASFVLLVLTLITSCFVGGTFAKYVSEGTGDDTARVAKWGVEVKAAGDAFYKVYHSPDGTANAVVSNELVVAPGTSGTFKGITLSGTPEVAVKIDTTVNLALENWTVDGQFYCPLIFTINSVKIEGSNFSSADALIEEFNKKISGAVSAERIDAGENLAESTETPILLRESTGGISWEWPYDVSAANDVKDTALGNAAAIDTNEPTISLTMTTTVTQVD